MTTVRLTVRDRTIPIHLNDSAAAADLLGQLPLTLDFVDYAGQEKKATLPRALDGAGAPDSAAAGPGDVTFYSPNRVLVLHYRRIGSFAGIVPLGAIDADDVAFVQGQDGPFTGRLER